MSPLSLSSSLATNDRAPNHATGANGAGRLASRPRRDGMVRDSPEPNSLETTALVTVAGSNPGCVLFERAQGARGPYTISASAAG